MRFIEQHISRLSVLVILLITALVYIPVFNNALTNWDDHMYVINNPYLKSLSFENIQNIFKAYHAGNYHPLTLISMALDYKIGGIQPWPYHLTNLILHLCNTFLVFVFVKSLLQLKFSDSGNFIVLPFVTAILFGIHPFQVESVAWISERKNVLYTFFFLSSLITYTKYLRNQSYKAYILSIVLFILALLSKGMAVPLSLCVIAIDYFAGRNLLSKSVILEKIPFLALSLLFGIVAIMAQHAIGATIKAETNFAWFERIAVASYGFLQYIIKLIFPYKLSAFYPYPVRPGTPLPVEYYASILFVLLFLFIVLRYIRHHSIMFFGVLFFVLNISIVIQLLPVGKAFMADRYMYVPSVGFFLIVGFYCNLCLVGKKKVLVSIISLMIVYLIFLGYKTHHRIGIWKDSLTLWNDVLRNYPANNTTAYINRASILHETGKYPEALDDYSKVLQIDPRNSGAYIGMGLTKQGMRDLQGALIDFNTSLSIEKSFDGYLNRAVLKLELDDLNGAMLDLNEAHKLDSASSELYINKGVIELRNGNNGEAYKLFNTAVEVNVNNYQAYIYRAMAKINHTDFYGAIADLDHSIQLHNSALAFFYKGLARINLSDHANAVNDFDNSIRLKPDAEAYYYRGVAKVSLTDFLGAIADLSKAIEIQPNGDKHYYRGIAYIQAGNKQEGCNDLQQAASLGNIQARNEAGNLCK